MAYPVNRAFAFDIDLDEALAYLTQALSSPRAAVALIDEIEKATTLLSTSPFMNAISRKPKLYELGLREHAVSGYVIAYRVNENEVLLLRLFHQSQMYERLVMEWN